MLSNSLLKSGDSYIPVTGVALALVACLAAQPAAGASSIEETGPGAGAPGRAVAPGAPQGPSGFGVSHIPPGPSRLDENGNGLSDGLEERLATLGPAEPVEVIVTFDGPGNAAAAQRAVGAFSVTHEYDLIPGFAATMSAAQAQTLANVPGVFRVQLDGTMYALMETARRDFGVDNPDTGQSWFLDANAEPLYTGAGVVVCVIDSGVWPWHEQFADDEQWVDSRGTKVEKFRDFVGDGASTETLPGDQAHDEHYHGTMVSAVAAGDGTPEPDSVGGDSTIAGPLRGAAPGAALWGAQVVEPAADGSATGPDGGVVAALDWCVSEWQDEGQARSLVINLSLGSPGGCRGDAVARAADQAFKAGAVVIAAAGNSGDAPGTVLVPACADGTLPVAAAADHSLPTTPELAGIESNGRYVAPFSSRGDPLTAGVTGPGVSIGSAFNTDQALFAVLDCPMTTDSEPTRGCYAMASGTSFAAPFVSGVAALMLEANPDLPPSDVYQKLRETAQPWGPGGTPNVVAGAGMVDGQAAVAAAVDGEVCVDYSPSKTPRYTFEAGSVGNSQTIQIPIWIEDPNLSLALTLSIDGQVNAFGVWSPDLDVYLLDAGGNRYLVENPLYPWLSSDPMIPAPGTSSTCPMGEDCGTVGAQETIHIALPVVEGEVLTWTPPDDPPYYLEVVPWEGFPNNGGGGSFTLELSNAYTLDPQTPPDPCMLVADAGPDIELTDDNSDGESVTLDGSASTGMIESYAWGVKVDTEWVEIASSNSPTVSHTFEIGTYEVRLEVSDADNVTATDQLVVTVKEPKKGGGKNKDGGGGGGGGNCNNPNKACTASADF